MQPRFPYARRRIMVQRNDDIDILISISLNLILAHHKAQAGR